MKVIEFLPTIESVLKAVTEFGINVKDYRYIGMYDEYHKMKKSRTTIDVRCMSR